MYLKDLGLFLKGLENERYSIMETKAREFVL